MIPTVDTCRGQMWQSPSGYYLVFGVAGWAIYRGVSRFLVAEGPAATAGTGRDLFSRLKARK